MSDHRIYERQDWRKGLALKTLQARTFFSLLREIDIAMPFDMLECKDIFLPLSCFLVDHILQMQLKIKKECLAKEKESKMLPYIIGVTGSVAVGKTSFCRQLKLALSSLLNSSFVEIVSTDCFLYPNHILVKKGLDQKKGFPASYDEKQFSFFLKSLIRGDDLFSLPIYSHESYDINLTRQREVRRPEVIILEGVHLFLNNYLPGNGKLFRPDAILYLDASENSIKTWFIERILYLKKKAVGDIISYFYRFQSFSDEEMQQLCLKIWNEVNLPNLLENILPHREISDIVFFKNINHRIDHVVIH